MKRFITLLIVTASTLLVLIATTRTKAADQSSRQSYEYATLRWAGRDNTHLIRPNGDVEFLGTQLKAVRKPDRADERSFFLSVAMNSLAKEGYEVAAITPDDVVMKRRIGQ